MSNSVDPDETAHMSRLIWIYAVCKNLLLSSVAVKGLTTIGLTNHACSCRMNFHVVTYLFVTSDNLFEFFRKHCFANNLSEFIDYITSKFRFRLSFLQKCFQHWT